MMTDFDHLATMSENEVFGWLKRALDNLESLPKLTRDEFPFLGIAKLWVYFTGFSPKNKWGTSLRKGILRLVREFCEEKKAYSFTQELLSLVSAIKLSAAITPLAELAQSEAFSSLPENIQCALLATLIDTSPRQSVEFWKRKFEKDHKYAGYAFSGILAQNFEETLLFLSSLEKESVKPSFWTGAQLKVSVSRFSERKQATLIKKIQSLAPPEE